MKATMSLSSCCRSQIYLLLLLETLTIFHGTMAGSDVPPVDVTFYEHEFFKGKEYKFTLVPYECVNVKQGGTFSSAKIGDTTSCVIFYNADNCRQRPVRFKAGNNSKGLLRFANVGANDDIKSIQICPPEKKRSSG